MNERKLYIDVLRSISAVAVVFLHVNAIFWSRPVGITWVSANVIESFFYFAVPCFFMITGLTLLRYRERYGTVTFFKRRFLRVLVPYAFWTLIVVVLVCTIIPVFLRHIGCEDLSSTIGYRTFGAMVIYVIVVIGVRVFMKVPIVGKCC